MTAAARLAPQIAPAAAHPAAHPAPPLAGAGADPVCLLAQGRLPHRPQLLPLSAAPVAPAPTGTGSWRRAHGLDDGAELLACTFDPAAAQGGPAASPLHPAQLAQDWAMLCARTATQRPALLYLHRGQQPDTRCPILQDLLAVLDHRGAVHALRVETPAARRDALAIARALTPRHGLLLVLHDPTQRLCPAPRATAPLRFLLLATQTQARRLQAADPHGAAPSHALHTETLSYEFCGLPG